PLPYELPIADEMACPLDPWRWIHNRESKDMRFECVLLLALRRHTVSSSRLTTKLSDGAPAARPASGRSALAQKVMVRARAPALYGSQTRALYASRRSLQRRVRRRFKFKVGMGQALPWMPTLTLLVLKTLIEGPTPSSGKAMMPPRMQRRNVQELPSVGTAPGERCRRPSRP